MVCVILRERAYVSEDYIKVCVKGQMSRHKTSKYVKFVDSFLMNAAGKINLNL
jgi:fatty-acyl-CoA synthase